MLGSNELEFFMARKALVIAPFSASFDAFFFTTLLIGGLCFFLILVLAVFVRVVERSPTWYNLCFGWVIFVLSYCMLLFGFGDEISRSPPGRIPVEVCVTQSSLIYAAPVLTANMMTALLCEFWMRINPRGEGFKEPGTLGSRGTVILLIYPHILWNMVIMANFQIGVGHPADIVLLQLGMYCHDRNSVVPGRISAALVSVANTASLFFLYKSFRAFRRCKYTLGLSDPPSRDAYSRLLTRVLVIFVLGNIATILAFAEMDDLVVNSCIAVLPLGNFVVLGVPRELTDKLRARCNSNIPEEQTETPATVPGDVSRMA